MPLSPGSRLAHYDIVAELGVGGMGAVYRARELKLNRDVAIKVLLASVVTTPDNALGEPVPITMVMNWMSRLNRQ